MSKDKKVLYILSSLILAVLLITLFVDIGSSKTVTAILLLLLTPITCLLIKKRSSHSIRKRDVIILMAAIAVLYIVFLQISGIYFGYSRNPYYVTKQVFMKYVLPLTVIIITTEIIRSVLLAQKNKVVDILAYISFVVAEMLMYSNLGGLSSFNKIMDLFGQYMFPAITANILYHYVSRKYGMLPNIIYRLLTVMYSYFASTIPALSKAMTSCVKIILPLIVWAFVAALFEEDRKKTAKKKKGGKLAFAGMVAAVVVMISIVMLISCQFRFGALVVATESMSGEINKGDMVIFERYEDQQIDKGQVIVFMRGGARIVHRVVQIDTIDGNTCYITKGDANEGVDPGYVTKDDIVGLTDMKVAYLGYPTLILREILSGKN